MVMAKDIIDETPIACSLSSDDLADRQLAWQQLLRTSLLARQRVPGGLRLIVRTAAVPDLRKLIDLERNCCPWITFAAKGDSVTLTAAGDGEEVLLQMFSVA
jgi:hypothetical protein